MIDDQLLRHLEEELADAGLTGSFVVRDLATGAQAALAPDLEYPIASLAKVPLALSVLQCIHDGRLHAATLVDVEPVEPAAAGTVGLSRFRHRARIAVEDLLYLSTAVSDNAASDALFDLVPPAEVNQALRQVGVGGITLRHAMRGLTDTVAGRLQPDDTQLAHSLAIEATAAGGGHPIAALDVARASVGTAAAFVDLLDALWQPSRIPAPVAEAVRELMAENVIRHRLAPAFGSDGSRWCSKTGTLLNLRHEVGVVEHTDGDLVAVAALTRSSVPASIQPAAEAVIARVARTLHDELRAG